MANPSERDTYLASVNGAFVEELYQRYLADPSSVDAEWARFFTAMDDDAGTVAKELNGASWSPSTARVIGNGEPGAPAEAPRLDSRTTDRPTNGASTSDVHAATNDSIQALMLIRSHRVRGHLYSKLDPLGLEKPAPHTELDPASYGFTAADSEREIYLHHRFLGLERAKLREIVQALRETYCGTVGIEYMHITSAEEKAWIQDRVEGIHNRTEFTGRGKAAILERLAEAEGIEKFLHTRYPGTKRFGLDGGEALIPALEQILKRGSQLGVEEVVLGMGYALSDSQRPG